MFDKLILSYKDEILDTTETSLVDKKVTSEKKLPCLHYFIGNYMLITISCYYYYEERWIKIRNIYYLMNNVEETDIENYMYYI